MRDLIFKNLTSKDKSRRVLCAKERIIEDGIATRIEKHLIYVIREADDSETEKKIKPELFVIKEKNSKVKRESFFIKMKGGLYAHCNKKLLHVSFLHSLRIDLSPEKVH